MTNRIKVKMSSSFSLSDVARASVKVACLKSLTFIIIPCFHVLLFVYMDMHYTQKAIIEYTRYIH